MENQELNPVTPEMNEELTSPIVEETETQQIDPTIEPVTIEPETTENEEPQQAISLESVMAMFGELKQKFDEKIAVDTYKNQLFDKMYAELQTLKNDPYTKTLKPIFMDIITFIDTMHSVVSKYDETPAEEELLPLYQKLRKEIYKVGGHLEDLLYNYGIEPYSAKAGDEFDPRTQQSKKTTQTDNPEEHKKIVTSLSSGYTWNAQLLRRESVHVSLCESQANPN